MKIQIASDLHLKFGNRTGPAKRAFVPVPDRDVLVLAGDIGRQKQARAFVERELATSPVVYVPGNHEYYSDRSRDDIDADWRAIAADNPGLHHLLPRGERKSGWEAAARLTGRIGAFYAINRKQNSAVTTLFPRTPIN